MTVVAAVVANCFGAGGAQAARQRGLGDCRLALRPSPCKHWRYRRVQKVGRAHGSAPDCVERQRRVDRHRPRSVCARRDPNPWWFRVATRRARQDRRHRQRPRAPRHPSSRASDRVRLASPRCRHGGPFACYANRRYDSTCGTRRRTRQGRGACRCTLFATASDIAPPIHIASAAGVPAPSPRVA